MSGYEKTQVAARPLSIAIVCENASFRMGGEAAIPLRFFREFRAAGHSVRLLTHARVRPELSGLLTPEEFEDTVFFEDLPVQKLIHRASGRLPSRLREIFVNGVISMMTEARQARHLRAAAPGRFDIVFRPVPISPKAISLLTVPGVPVFYGPLNGAMDYPPAFRGKEGGATAALIAAGRRLSRPLHRLFPAKGQAAGIFLSNPRTLAALPANTARVPKYRSYDATVDATQWRQVVRGEGGGEISADHFLYVGRLVDWKAVDYAIRAVHALSGRARLTVVGDGPERARLERMAAGGPGRIEFLGYLPHDALRALYGDICAQLLPSLREAGGNVCMEALAAGVPVIATGWGGARDVVRDGVDGILVPPENEAALIAGFAEAMERFIAEPERARAMGLRGRQRVLDGYSWAAKARDYLEVFRATLEGRAPPGRPGEALEIHPDHQSPETANGAWADTPSAESVK